MAFQLKLRLPTAERALPGRAERMPVPAKHFVNGHPLVGPYPDGLRQAVFGMGCFWGAERLFWQTKGVFTTAVGYAGGFTPNPTYEEVCSGLTGHTEAVLVVHDPQEVGLDELLKVFWEGHDPTQGMRQGNDVGTQYRSAIYLEALSSPQSGAPLAPKEQPDHDGGVSIGSVDSDLEAALASRERYQEALMAAGYGAITTEIKAAPPFYYAEAYHQQYLAKVPNGYCGLGGTGVTCFEVSKVAAGG
ncbi:MAG: peptide-methionine (S)-S-oxide reductase MsrA [Gammaproteobacteria bacterium]|nr:peptide-methionine (S)-S-oxide reductase MsrA [Gammaproteobacteria bacterium]